MHTIYTERCPHCGKLYYYKSVERTRYFGVPELTCPNSKCGKKFFDSKGNEWENLTNEEKKSVLMYLYTGQKLEDGVQVYTEKELKAQIRANYFGLIFTIPALMHNKKLLKQWQEFKFNPTMLEDATIQESIKRTSNPEYREFLLNMGKNFYGMDYDEE